MGNFSTLDSLGGASSLLSSLPLCMVVLDPASLHPLAINDMFEEHLGPLYKFADCDFISAANDDDESDARDRLKAAIESVIEKKVERSRVRDVEMTTLSDKLSGGFPVRKRFDWFVSENEGAVVLLGDPCSEQDVHQREKDAELIDFFQNAPIALHWLSGDGKVLWANQTELNVLGYTAEEYIGQPIMKFCPDEEELVLEIFKQLGSGNTIRDVPVRFRTKDGRLVNLLIDSNVKYNRDGSFGHTRCFIRDDTGRKIREARASLLLEETKRSLKMLDNFMSRSLHHMRTPLHVVQCMVDSITSVLDTNASLVESDRKECLSWCKEATRQIGTTVHFLNDVAALSRFDQGSVLHLHPEVISLEKFGKEILDKLEPTPRNVEVVLDLRGNGLGDSGPGMAVTDPKVLKRVLIHLLNNAVDVTKEGTVSLGIGYRNKRLTFAVSDTGPGLEMAEGAAKGDLPTIFQRYHQEFIPEESVDIHEVSSLRKKVEEGVNSHRKNGLGIGLSLSYHLVQALGGELSFTSSKGQGSTFYFSLNRNASFNSTIPMTSKLESQKIACSTRNSDSDQSMALVINQGLKRSARDNQGCESIEGRNTKFKRSPLSFEMPKDSLLKVPSSIIAERGVKSVDPPSVLVVEDTKTCAKMLCMTLTKFDCSTKWAENGKIAVDLLRTAPEGTYDLILMDLRMPVMDGLEATKIIKQELGLKIPVVALTGEDNEGVKEECFRIGFDGYRGKPMNRRVLKEVIQQYTGREVK